MNYHVLSNQDIISIIQYSLGIGIFLSYMFANLGRRAPSPIYKKGIIGKIVPWIIIPFFLWDIYLLISYFIDYPWEIEAQPSVASADRELQYYHGSGYPIWGWANDYQLKIANGIGGCICFWCWIVYAFAFKRSDTGWGKKLLKVVAYLWLSMLIVGFSFHDFRDLVIYGIFLIPVFVLLYFARVKQPKAIRTVVETNKENNTKKTIEDDSSKELPTEELVAYTAPQTIEDNHNIEQKPMNEIIEDSSADTIYVSSNEFNTNLELNELTSQEPLDEQSEVIYCKHCGKEIESDSAYCKFCGKKIN